MLLWIYTGIDDLCLECLQLDHMLVGKVVFHNEQ